MPTLKRKLRVNMKGDDVAGLHQSLLKLALSIPPDEVEQHRFGKHTRQAIIEFQATHCLEPTGIVDERSAGVINAELKKIRGAGPRQGEPSAAISDKFIRALKVNLSAHLTGGPESPLAKMIEDLELSDIAAAKDMTLRQYAMRALGDNIGKNTEVREEYEQLLTNLPDDRTINVILQLDQPLDQHPMFTDLVRDARLDSVLALTKLGEQADRVKRFKSVLDRCGGLHSGFWKVLAEENVVSPMEIKDIKLSFELTALALDNVELVKTLKSSGIGSILDLIPLHRDDWLKLLKDNEITPPESFKGEQPLNMYATHLESAVTEAYPTEMFIDRLKAYNIEAIKEDLICMEPFLQANPSISLDQEIAFRKVHWHTEDRRERNRVKRSIESLRKSLKLYSRLGLATIVNDPRRKPDDKFKAIKRKLDKLNTFLNKNPKLDLKYADFHRGYATTLAPEGEKAPPMSWEGLRKADQVILKQQLMTYQRLFRLHPRFNTAQVLLENDLDSAHKIILMTEEQFVEGYEERLYNPSPNIPKYIYSKALGIAENTIHQWANVKDLMASPTWKGFLSNNVSKALKQYYHSFQSYQDMFGSLNFCECQDCQSIFGPAAYFVDLMRFIDLNITKAKANQIPVQLELKKRRPDLWHIPLDCANSETLVSHLDLVNEILETQLGATQAKPEIPYENLRDAVHPFSLPFNRPLTEMRIYLSHFKKSLSEIYEAFGVSGNAVASEYLGFSKEDKDLLTTAGLNQNKLANVYGIAIQQLFATASGGLARVETFLKHTGLTRKELDELLFQNIGQAEKAGDVQARFFINKVGDGLGSLAVALDTEINQSGNTVPFEKIDNFSERKLNNIHRFVRLAKKLGWSFADLDWVLWSIGGPADPAGINQVTLTRLSKIKQWREKYELQLDVLCSFWYLVKHIGQGEIPDTAPLDLFNRVFNHPDILKGRDPYNLANPDTWKLNSATDEHRNRLLAAIEITNEELNLIVEQIKGANANELELNHSNLSRLYRFSRIPDVLKFSVHEFVWLLSLMKKNGLIANAEIKSLADFEKLVQVSHWLKTAELSVYDLHYVLTSTTNSYVEAGYTDTAIRLLTEDLDREFKNALIKSTVFTAINGVDQNLATIIYDKLVTDNFLVEENTGARLTAAFKPEAPGFTLGLPQALVPFEKQIIEILKAHDESKVALKRLAIFFNIEPDLLQSVIAFASQKLDDPALLKLLASPLKENDAIPPQINNFLRLIHVRLFLSSRLEFTQPEIDSIVAHPEYYGINDLMLLKIADIETLYYFKELVKDYRDTRDGLIGYFKPGTRQDKISHLAELTEWSQTEIELLFDEFWPGQNTDYSHVAAVRKLKNCFDLSLYMGVGIKPLLEWVKMAGGDWDDCRVGAKSAFEILKAKYSEAEWKQKYEPLVDQIRTLKRDALVPIAIWNIDKGWPANIPHLKNPRDLYAHLLIDVEMTSCAKTSKIAQGIAGLQLYIQRCQMNLEPGIKPESVPTKQWEWMKNYRVWEANRKVFLYPENYIVPTLRDNKTPISEELEDELLQSEVTAETVETAYRNYLNKFAELANLKIAGSYHDTDTDTLYLFGRTNTQPYTYYYRTYEKQTTWTPWVKVNLSIKVEYVSPIYAFNRLFVFWVELSKTKESKIEQGASKDPVEMHKATVNYSFYDFNKKWVQPQTLSEIDDQSVMMEPDGTYWNLVYPVRLKEVQSKFDDEIYIKYGGRVGSNYNLIGFVAQTLRNNLGSSNFNTSLLPISLHRINRIGNAPKVSLALQKITGNEIDIYNYYSEVCWPRYYQNLHNEVYLLKDRIFEKATIQTVNSSKKITRFVFDNDDEAFLIHFYWTAWFYSAFAFTRITTSPIHTLSQQLLGGGLDELLSIRTQQNNSELDFQRLSPDPVVVPPLNEPHLDFTGAYGHYYWEVFFHISFLVADRLNADQKFDEAQKWYHYIYNPTIQQPEKGETIKEEKDIVWRFLPFRDLTLETLQNMLASSAALEEYHQNPFKPHAIARLRLSAYQKAIVMNYIDNLLDWGDYLFAQDTREAINQATQLYVLAYNLLGPRPEKLGSCVPDQPLTFEDIEKNYHQGKLIPEFLIELENSTIAAASSNGAIGLNNAFFFYFCVPENEEFLRCWERVESSLTKIRHCMNIKGMVRELALFSPPISPMALVQAAATGRDISSVLTEVLRPVPPYRFAYMLEKAKSLCATVQQLGSALLSALEKKDAEDLALIRATHEKNILQLTVKVRENQHEEAKESLDALLDSKASATTRHKHYKDLFMKGLSHHEKKHLASMLIAWGLEQQANILSTMASIGYAVPQAGSPFAMTYGGRELGAILTAVAHAFRAFSSFYTLSGSMSSTLGSYERRRQDWNLQQKLAQHDLDQFEKQIAAAKLREQIAQQEIDIHAKNIDQTDKIYDFMKGKFTSKDLYQWLANQLSGLYFQTYKLAYDLAKSAEKAYQYERDTAEIYINFGHWDSLKKGLLAGERLILELNQLEKAYLDEDTRLFEIEKAISLAYINPLALIELRTEGICKFQLQEELFDCDFPGHYCRKIKTIAISIPAIAGPYENIKATLTQTSHRTLLQPDTTALIANSVKFDTNSDNVRSDWIKNQQIAISRGVNDNGMFELNFRDERYLPFEGTGAVSNWELEMPKATNRIDFDSISDVIIHLKYTARHDGTLRTKIQGLLKKVEGYRILSLKHEFSTAWYRFMNPETGKTEHQLKFSVSEKLFPPNTTNYKIKSLYLKVDLASGILPLGNNLKLTIMPAKANNIQVTFKEKDTTEEKQLSDTSALGEWGITVDRKDGIPFELQRKKDGNIEIENINGQNCYYMDSEKFKNLGLLLLYEADIQWPDGGN